ncbi:MAG: hypothetical protein QXR60_04090 [Candidatus Nanoarchaeia archaeon]
MGRLSEKNGKVFKSKQPLLFLLWAFAVILVAQEGKAEMPMCGDTVQIVTNCTMLTPTMLGNCTTYDIIHSNGTVAQNVSELSLVNGNIYGFNFTLPQGDYLVRLCDGTTREVHALPRDKDMIATPLFLGLLLFICLGLTVYFTSIHKSMAFSYLFLLLTIVFLDMTVWVGARMASDAGQSWAFAMWRIFWIMIMMTLLFFAFLFVHWVIWSIDKMHSDKKKKEEEMYGPAWRV